MSDGLSKRNRLTRCLTMAGVVSAMVAGVLSLGAGVATAAAPSISSTPGAYIPVTPTRVCDTRAGTGTFACASGQVAAGGTLVVPISAVPANATAAVVNITATNAGGQGFLTPFPTGTAEPTASVINFTNGQTVANQATVQLGANGSGTPSISIANGPSNGGPVDVVVDLQGYYAPPLLGSGNAGEYTGVVPARAADTRCFPSIQTFCSAENIPPVNQSAATIGAGGTDNITVTGLAGVPSTGVSAVVVNVTDVNAVDPSFFTVFAAGSARPGTSNMNWAAGEVLSAKVIAPVGTNGQISIYNLSGTVDAVVDVEGFVSSSSGPAGDLFTPVAPTRVIGSLASGVTVPAGGSTSATIAGNNGVPAGALAAALNATDIQPTFGNFLTVYPSDAHAPVASDVNFIPANTYNVVPNAAYATLSTTVAPGSPPVGSFSILNGPADTNNNAGPAGVDADLYGYFTPATTPPPTGTGSVTSTPASGPAGTQITGTVVNPNQVNSIAITGCGVGQTIPASAINPTTGVFTFNIPNAQAAGACTLQYVSAITTGPPVTSTSPFNVTGAAVTGTVTFAPNSGVAGTTVTGSVTNPASVNNITVSGCGINNQLIAGSTFNTTGTFTFVIPAAQATGACTLNFVANNANNTQTNSNGTFTVTGPAPPPAGTGLGTPPTAQAPVLLSANITTNGFIQAVQGQSIVQYVFSGPVQPNATINGCGATSGVGCEFSLLGFDTGRSAVGLNANQDGPNPNAIDVSYATGIDPASYTVAVAANNNVNSSGIPEGSSSVGNGTNTNPNAETAVVGSQGADTGLNNPLGSVPLGGSTGPTSVTTGNTTAPDLLNCVKNGANPNQLFYNFDKGVTAPGAAALFGYYDSSGTLLNKGASVAPFTSGGTQIAVNFANPVAPEVRCETQQGAASNTASLGTSPLAGVGAATGAPDLVAITPVGTNSTQFDFHFNKNVNAVTAQRLNYFLYANNAQQYVGQVFINVVNLNTVRIDFVNAVAPVFNQATVGNIVSGAVNANTVPPTTATTAAQDSSTTLFNTIGSQPISGIVLNGQITDGPQLQSATGTASGLSVTYMFNPQPNGAGLTAPVAADFFVINNAGVANFGSGATISGNNVTVGFTAGALASAVGAGVIAVVGGFRGDEAANGVTAIFNTAGRNNVPGTVTLTVGP